jgi:transposase
VAFDGGGYMKIRHRHDRREQSLGSKSLTGDKGYDSDSFRKALIEKGIEPCIPPGKNRKCPQHYDEALYKKRHKIENSFSWLKEWRRIATRYDRSAHAFFSAVCIAASFIFYLK